MTLQAHDTATARITQGLAVLHLLETSALTAAEEGGSAPEISPARVAEAVWAARTMFEHAREALRQG